MQKIPKPLAESAVHCGICHFEVHARCPQTGRLHSFDFGPVGGDITLKTGSSEASVARDGKDARSIKGAPGEIREAVIEELPAGALYVGRSPHMRLEDVRAYSALQPTVYKLHQNDCRHYVNNLVRHATGLERATVQLLRTQFAERVRTEREQMIEQLAAAWSSSPHSGGSSGGEGLQHHSRSSSDSGAAASRALSRCASVSGGMADAGEVPAGQQGLLIKMLRSIPHIPPLHAPIIYLGQWMTDFNNWPAVQRLGLAATSLMTAASGWAAAKSAQLHVRLPAAFATHLGNGSAVAAAASAGGGALRGLLVPRLAAPIGANMGILMRNMVAAATRSGPAALATIKSRAASVAPPVLAVAHSSRHRQEEEQQAEAQGHTHKPAVGQQQLEAMLQLLLPASVWQPRSEAAVAASAAVGLAAGIADRGLRKAGAASANSLLTLTPSASASSLTLSTLCSPTSISPPSSPTARDAASAAAAAAGSVVQSPQGQQGQQPQWPKRMSRCSSVPEMRQPHPWHIPEASSVMASGPGLLPAAGLATAAAASHQARGGSSGTAGGVTAPRLTLNPAEHGVPGVASGLPLGMVLGASVGSRLLGAASQLGTTLVAWNRARQERRAAQGSPPKQRAGWGRRARAVPAAAAAPAPPADMGAALAGESASLSLDYNAASHGGSRAGAQAAAALPRPHLLVAALSLPRLWPPAAGAGAAAPAAGQWTLSSLLKPRPLRAAAAARSASTSNATASAVAGDATAAASVLPPQPRKARIGFFPARRLPVVAAQASFDGACTAGAQGR